MTNKLKFLVPALLAGFIMVGCGQQAEDGMPAAEETMNDMAGTASDAAEAVEEAASDMADATSDMAESVTNEPGGYVPADDELVPGETRP